MSTKLNRRRRWQGRSPFLLWLVRVGVGGAIALLLAGSGGVHIGVLAQTPSASLMASAIPMAQATTPEAPEAPEPSESAEPDGSIQPRRERRIRRSEVWQEVYRQLPDLPKADQYRFRETGQDSGNTLVQRLISYHEQRGRSLYHRFDWKLTLADYLGVNEVLSPEVYPGSTRFTPDPLAGDRDALSQLNRAQRDKLINLLVQLYNPRIPAPAAVTDAAPALSEANPPAAAPPPLEDSPASPAAPPSARPGDAQLLLP